MILEMISVEKGFDTGSRFALSNWTVNCAPSEQTKSVEALRSLSPAWRNQMQKGCNCSCISFWKQTTGESELWSALLRMHLNRRVSRARIEWKSIIEALWLSSWCYRGVGREDGTQLRLMRDSDNTVTLVRVGQPQVPWEEIFHRHH